MPERADRLSGATLNEMKVQPTAFSVSLIATVSLCQRTQLPGEVVGTRKRKFRRNYRYSCTGVDRFILAKDSNRTSREVPQIAVCQVETQAAIADEREIISAVYDRTQRKDVRMAPRQVIFQSWQTCPQVTQRTPERALCEP